MREGTGTYGRLPAWMVFALVAALLTGAGCRRPDRVTREIRVPGLRCGACAERVRMALLAEYPREDVPVIEPDPDTGLLRITYDRTALALKNLEWTLSRAGYAAGDLPADPAARERLPESCRHEGEEERP